MKKYCYTMFINSKITPNVLTHELMWSLLSFLLIKYIAPIATLLVRGQVMRFNPPPPSLIYKCSNKCKSSNIIPQENKGTFQKTVKRLTKLFNGSMRRSMRLSFLMNFEFAADHKLIKKTSIFLQRNFSLFL